MGGIKGIGEKKTKTERMQKRVGIREDLKIMEAMSKQSSSKKKRERKREKAARRSGGS